MSKPTNIPNRPRLAVIWIDWYPYHVARLEGLLAVPELAGRVIGIELVGGIGVHAGLRFREQLPAHLPIHTLMPERNWDQAGQFRLARLLWSSLTELNPEAVLVPGYYTLPSITSAIWARIHRRMSILMTESTAHDHLRAAWKERAKSILLRVLFDCAVAGGKAQIRYLAQLQFPIDCVARCYDVVDNNSLAARTIEARKSSAADFGLPAHPYFLYVGRMSPEKNVEGLLTAWLSYREAGGTWPLVLVGDGPSLRLLQALAACSQFVNDVHFAGLRNSRELPAYYAFAGCFVLPSLRESWGLVVNEAMASGLPLLVSSHCGSAEDLVEEGRNGFTFDPTSHQLSARLHQMAAFPREELRSMGERSRQIIASYSPQIFGSEILSLLQTAGA